MKNQVLRKAEKFTIFTILISYFHELWKLKSLPPPPSLSSLRENVTLSKSALSFWNKWYHKQEHYVIMIKKESFIDICHISQNVEK